MPTTYLMSFGADEDRAEAVKFRTAWKEKYPDYPVRVKANPHDFGTYHSIEMSDKIFHEADRFFTENPVDGEVGVECVTLKFAEDIGLDV